MSRKINLKKSEDLALAAWAVAMRLQQFGYAEISSETGCSIRLATLELCGNLGDGVI